MILFHFNIDYGIISILISTQHYKKGIQFVYMCVRLNIRQHLTNLDYYFTNGKYISYVVFETIF